MYKYVLNSVVKIFVLFAKYFEYYIIILRDRILWTLCSSISGMSHTCLYLPNFQLLIAVEGRRLSWPEARMKKSVFMCVWLQSCTEMVMPICSDGVNDMFEPNPWNLTQVIAECRKRWNVSPRPRWVVEQYGGKNISAASNIIFRSAHCSTLIFSCWVTVCKTVCPMLSDRCPVCDVDVLWLNGWMDQDETWDAGRPRSWPHYVRWEPSSPSPKGGAAPQPSSHVCCGQMAAWIKMPLGIKVGLGPSDFVLDGDPAPPPQKVGQSPPIFGPCLLWPNGCVYQDTGYTAPIVSYDEIWRAE